jgi:hypothetical protein
MDLDLGGETAAPARPPIARKAASAPVPASGAGEGIIPSPVLRYRQPSREGMKRIQGHFSPRVKRQLGLIGLEHDKTEEELVGEALDLLFKAYGKPAIAFEGKDRS